MSQELIIGWCLMVIPFTWFTSKIDETFFRIKGFYHPYEDRIESNTPLVYFHELRHKQQSEKGFLKWGSSIILVCVLFTSIFRSWEYIVPAVLVYLSWELDAWVYAFYKKREYYSE